MCVLGGCVASHDDLVPLVERLEALSRGPDHLLGRLNLVKRLALRRGGGGGNGERRKRGQGRG
eukprot:862553-Pleurochrysis_carterae.AAC.1